MSILEKLLHKKKQNKLDEQTETTVSKNSEEAIRFQEDLNNAEAMQKVDNTVDVMLPEPEGDYILKENGDVYLRYTVLNESKIANKHKLPKLVEKSKKELKQAEEIVNRELDR